MPQYRIYVCDTDGHLLCAHQHNGTAQEACDLAGRLLSEAGPGADSIEVWLGDRRIKTIARKPG
jgi:hypothetical protein